MNKKPNKWAAAALGCFSAPLAMLYVVQPTWAAVYMAAFWMVMWHAQTPWPLAVQVLLGLGICAVGAVQAYRFAVHYPADKPRPHYSRWYGIAAIWLVLFAMVIAVFFFLDQVSGAGRLGI